MSKREALVVPVDLIPVPESHSLSVVKINDYKVAVRTEDWKGKTKALYLEPDSLAPTDNLLFDFLTPEAKYNADSYLEPGGTYARIRAKRFLKGLITSYGLLVPVDESIEIGTNLYESLKISHYEPRINNKGSGPDGGVLILGENEESPDVPYNIPVYDVENGLKFARSIFTEGEPVWGSLKYHGANLRCGYINGKMYVGSRNNWKKEFPSKPILNKQRILDKYGEEEGQKRILVLEEKLSNWKSQKSTFWNAVQQNPWLTLWCQENPGYVVYGEMLNVQGAKFNYRCKPNENKVAVFDLFKDGRFLDCKEAREVGAGLDWVHTFYEDKPFNIDECIKLAENLPNIANDSIEEGLVVRSSKERFNDCTGRTIVKFISPKYSEKS